MSKSRVRAATLALCALVLLVAPATSTAAPDHGNRASALRAHDLRVGYMTDPLGIDDTKPSLSWRLSSHRRDQTQLAYEVRVATSPRLLAAGRADVWDSGRVASRDSVDVPYGGPALHSRERLFWTVRTWDDRGRPSPWAKPARWEMGLLSPADWSAHWITDPDQLRRQEPLVIHFPSRRVRYLRIDVTRLGLPLKEGWPYPVSRLQLAEVQAFGGGTLQSAGAAVSASEAYIAPGTWEPRFVTDGKLDSNGSAAGYTSFERREQDLDAPIWLQLDLGKVVDVDEVRLYPRTDTLTADHRVANFPEDFSLETRTDGSEPWSEAYSVTDQAAPAPPKEPEGLPLLARTFTLDKRVKSARLYAVGLGISEARLNGRKVGDAVLEPANTDYRKRVRYTTYDVTSALRHGDNTLGFALGNGIYNVPPTPGRYQKFSGSMGQPKLLAQLEITFADGSRRTIASDGSWRTTSGPTTFTAWYGGEDYDARREQPGWDAPGADLSGWHAVEDEGAAGAGPVLSAQEAPPVRAQETVSAVSRKEVAPGVWQYDLGREVAGWPQITVTGAKGETATLRPSERLTNGRVDQSSVGSPVYFRYTAKSDGTETWHPRFTYYGFRYVEVEGLSSPPAADDVQAIVLRADNPRTGSFASSDPMLDDIHELVTNAVEGNMYSVLTDCPTREKLGWLEEDHLLYDTVAANYDVAAYYRQLVRNMSDAQLDNGLVPDIAPEYTVFGGGFRDDPNWGGAVIMAPWKQYLAYGDATLLRSAYPAMQRYMDYLGSKASDHVLGYGLGDWGAFDNSTPLGIAATSGYYTFATTMEKIAGALGRDGDAAGYATLAGQIRDAFNARFYDADAKSYGSGSQASNALPLAAGLVPDADRAAVLASLKDDIAARGGHLSTGEIGLRGLFDALGEAGDADTVLEMAENPTEPSYAAMLAGGATTLPEFWDGHGSQNHFMMGAIDDWSYRYLAGIRSTGPGFRTFTVDPLIPEGLDHVSARWDTAYGPIHSAWRKTGSALHVDVDVPVNTTATVSVPVGRHARPGPDGARLLRVQDGRAVYEVGSGHWRFTGAA